MYIQITKRTGGQLKNFILDDMWSRTCAVQPLIIMLYTFLVKQT